MSSSIASRPRSRAGLIRVWPYRPETRLKMPEPAQVTDRMGRRKRTRHAKRREFWGGFLAEPAPSPFEKGRDMTTVSMVVNGRPVSGEVEGRTLLVQFLREGLGLTGTHIGCDTSQCGACTVHVDGESVKSCTIFAMACEGAEITTIEGMANADGSLSPLQQAFQDNHGLQCGFCTPGMVMSAADLLKRTASPSEDEIRNWLEGNLCRCTGYHNIIRSIQAAAAVVAVEEVAAE